jgi:DNA-binding NarL/FixJ family response regulator
MPSRMVSSNSSEPPRSGAGSLLSPGIPAEGLGARPLRVYLVEDAPSFRDRLFDFLAEPGEVEMVGFAETEADALRQLRAEPPDVVIVDLHLKAGSGIGVIESVRALRPTPPPTIVVLTNYAFPEFEVACRARGANYFFDKSSQFGAVKALLRSLRNTGH